MNIFDEQTKLKVEYLKSDIDFFGWGKQYRGNESVGCVIYWIHVYNGLNLAEHCCVGKNTVYTNSSCKNVVATFEWVEDAPNDFRPHFEFNSGYEMAQEKQELYEKYILVKENN
jgi:hypothetical protein